MHFIDEAKIYLKAGDGGDGCVSFRREKYIDMGGPDGGDGGRGGDIILECDGHINTLLNFRYKQHFKANNGENGKGANRSGKAGESLILKAPIGTQIFSEDELLLCDLISHEQRFEILRGADGGLGNSRFKSSMNQAPKRRTEGGAGHEMVVNLKLKLISDAGLIGLPNAGKSTFLSIVTAAKPKIADYPFTTLAPNLGVVYIDQEEFVLADIPGLIEGSHLGHGLGEKFLKHIERCGILVHIIDGLRSNIAEDYQTIRHELESYSNSLKDKIEIICINKCESLSKEEIKSKITILDQLTHNKLNITEYPSDNIFAISTYTRQGVEDVIKFILQTIKLKE
jgi:GTP-binding protein